MLIYLFTNLINGKKYVGKTKNSLSSRICSHKCASKKNNPTQLIHRAIKKYGIEKFSITTIEQNIDTVENLNKKEVFYIDLYKTTNSEFGYNVLLGGNGGTGMNGNKNPNFGKKCPDLSERNRKNKGKTFEEIYGKEKSDTLRKNVSALSTGRKLSEDAKSKISDARKKMWENGVYDKPETREKFSHNKGKPSPLRRKIFSPELNKEFESLSSAAAYIGTGAGNICSVLKGKLKHIKGYTFIYLENKDGL